jgi:hypothetical protein
LESAIDELENGLLFFEMISFCENYTTNQIATVIKDFGKLFNQVGGLKKQIENKIHASNDEGKEYYEENCEGLIFNISQINYNMKCMNIEPVFGNINGGEYTIKELLKTY